MKFGKSWKFQSEELPVQLASRCINYKVWKKLVKTVRDHDSLLHKLKSECKAVDKVMLTRQTSGVVCSLVRLSAQDIHNFAALNKQTLYKICKKLDKQLGTNKFMQWYATRPFAFLGGSQFTRLQLDATQHVDECPVCYDIPNTVIILDCGHYLCIECFKDWFRIRGQRGMLWNVVMAVEEKTKEKKRCPMCSKRNPCLHLSAKNLWPFRREIAYALDH